MYNNIGEKIKILVKSITIIGFIIFGVGGIILALTSSFIIGTLVAVLGCLSLWLSSFVLYGFGELIEQVSSIAKNTLNIEKTTHNIVNNTNKAMSSVKKTTLRDDNTSTSTKEKIFDDDITCISMYTLWNNKEKKLTLPNSVIEIAMFAFRDCQQLETLIIPNSVKKIGKNAFSGCKNATIFMDIDKNTFIDVDSFNPNNCHIYWKGEWKYNQNGEPISIK